MKNTPENNKKRYSALCSKIKTRHISLMDSKKIMYCEAAGSYTWIYLKSGEKIKVSCRIGVVEEKLHSRLFVRCHSSYIVNIKQVVKISDQKPYTIELKNGAIIKVSRRKKDDFLIQTVKYI